MLSHTIRVSGALTSFWGLFHFTQLHLLLMWVSMSLCMWSQNKRSRTRWSVCSTPKCSISSCSWFNISERNFGGITSWVRVDVWCWRTPSASHYSLAFSRAKTNNSLWTSLAISADTLLHLLQQWILLLCSSQLSALSSSGEICLTVSFCGSLLTSVIAVAMVSGHRSSPPSPWWMDTPLEKLDNTSGCICWDQVSMYFSLSSGMLANLSASALHFPGQYLIENLKSANSATHLS